MKLNVSCFLREYCITAALINKTIVLFISQLYKKVIKFCWSLLCMFSANLELNVVSQSIKSQIVLVSHCPECEVLKKITRIEKSRLSKKLFN